MITTRFYISVGGGSRAGAVWRIMAITTTVWSVGGVLLYVDSPSISLSLSIISVLVDKKRVLHFI